MSQINVSGMDNVVVNGTAMDKVVFNGTTTWESGLYLVKDGVFNSAYFPAVFTPCPYYDEENFDYYATITQSAEYSAQYTFKSSGIYEDTEYGYLQVYYTYINGHFVNSSEEIVNLNIDVSKYDTLTMTYSFSEPSNLVRNLKNDYYYGPYFSIINGNNSLLSNSLLQKGSNITLTYDISDLTVINNLYLLLEISAWMNHTIDFTIHEIKIK